MTRSTLALAAGLLAACNPGTDGSGLAPGRSAGATATPMPTLDPTTTAKPATPTSTAPFVSPTTPTRTSPTLPTTASPAPPSAAATSTTPPPAQASPTTPTRNSPTSPSPPAALPASSPDELPAAPQFRACQADADCVAVSLDACCPHGVMEAVNEAQTDAYRAAFHCPTVQAMCPLWMRKDPRVARCDAATKLCTMVAP